MITSEKSMPEESSQIRSGFPGAALFTSNMLLRYSVGEIFSGENGSGAGFHSSTTDPTTAAQDATKVLPLRGPSSTHGRMSDRAPPAILSVAIHQPDSPTSE